MSWSSSQENGAPDICFRSVGLPHTINHSISGIARVAEPSFSTKPGYFTGPTVSPERHPATLSEFESLGLLKIDSA